MFRKILYSIDILNREYCSGWCFHRLFRNSPVSLSFYLGDQLVGEVVCDQNRDDLHEQKLHPTGACGFECVFRLPLDVDSGRSLTIVANNSAKPIMSSAVSDIVEVFKPSPRPLFFMHIPKTAGTSFNNYIRQYFGYGRSQTHIEALDLAQQQTAAARLDYLAGHITLEHIPTIFNGQTDLELHSIVREPLKQLHSHMAWIKGIAVDTGNEFFHKHHAVIKKMGTRFYEFDFSDPKVLDQFVNNIDGFQIDFFDNIQTRYFLDYRPDRVGEADLKRAIENLSRFKTLGTTEQYDNYIDGFCSCYNLKRAPTTSRHNTARVDSIFDVDDPNITKILSPLVRYDQMLYDEIKQT